MQFASERRGFLRALTALSVEAAEEFAGLQAMPIDDRPDAEHMRPLVDAFMRDGRI